jgi:hypothetical protein
LSSKKSWQKHTTFHYRATTKSPRQLELCFKRYFFAGGEQEVKKRAVDARPAATDDVLFFQNADSTIRAGN